MSHPEHEMMLCLSVDECRELANIKEFKRVLRSLFTYFRERESDIFKAAQIRMTEGGPEDEVD
jgi:hypothetical protein